MARQTSRRQKVSRPPRNAAVASLRPLLLSLWDSNAGQAYALGHIAQLLSISSRVPMANLRSTLSVLVREGRLHRVKGRYQAGRAPTLRVVDSVGQQRMGRVDHVSLRNAYVIVEGEEGNDIYVNTRNLMSAVHNDTVRVALSPTRGGRREGRVIEIVERKRTRFAGRVELSQGHTFVIPNFKKIYQAFFIPPDQTQNVQPRDKALVEVTLWGDERRDTEARVIERLGRAGENEAEIHSIISEFDLPIAFDEGTLSEAHAISDGIPEAEIRKRRDFRPTLTFTIDPEDAKDFDDALSFRKLENGNYEVGVHIADVSHYVRPNTALDRAAYDRATSVYLVDRTIPMLPERLSNQLCSLMPYQDRPAFAVVFEVSLDAKVRAEWFGKTVIRSRHRLSYEQAQQAMDTGAGECAAALHILNQMAHRLRQERIDSGAIDLDTTEVKFVLDENKSPIQVIPKERKDTHKLIEEFMLLANRAVAHRMFQALHKQPTATFVYRTHDTPDADRVADFARFAKQFGHRINESPAAYARSVNALMRRIEGKPEQNALQQLAIRTMAKAKYTTEAKGHFGLAFDHYTHFTSPIRRYPDLLAHRMLEAYLAQRNLPGGQAYEAQCIHCSEREKRASDAERASIKYKQVEFMAMAEDKTHKGIITGISDFGIFVEIAATRCEGMVKIRDMRDDFYEVDEKNFCVVGKRRKKIYRLGDLVRVRVTKTDIDRRTIDLVMSTE